MHDEYYGLSDQDCYKINEDVNKAAVGKEWVVAEAQ